MGKTKEPNEPNLKGSSSYYDFPFTSSKDKSHSSQIQEREEEEPRQIFTEPQSGIYGQIVLLKPDFKQIAETFLNVFDFEEKEDDESKKLASYILLRRFEKMKDFTYFPMKDVLAPIKNLESVSDEFRSVDLSLERILAGNVHEEKRILENINLKNEKYFIDVAHYISSINNKDERHLWLTFAYMEAALDKLYLLVSQQFKKDELRMCRAAFNLTYEQ